LTFPFDVVYFKVTALLVCEREVVQLG